MSRPNGGSENTYNYIATRINLAIANRSLVSCVHVRRGHLHGEALLPDPLALNVIT